MPHPAIREHQPGDLPGILALQAAADVDLAARVPDDFYDDLRHVDAAYHGGALLVAELDGTIVGMGGLLPTGEIVRMRTDPGQRRKGIASGILSALLARAGQRRLKRVFLHTLREQTAAQQLYLTAGFRESGRGEIHGNPVIAYEKWL